MTLQKYLKEREDKRDEAVATIIGYAICPFIGGWLYVWDNHVWLQWNIGYWQFVALTIPVMLMPKWMKSIIGAVTAITMLAQVAYWVGLCPLPLIKP